MGSHVGSHSFLQRRSGWSIACRDCVIQHLADHIVRAHFRSLPNVELASRQLGEALGLDCFQIFIGLSGILWSLFLGGVAGGSKLP